MPRTRTLVKRLVPAGAGLDEMLHAVSRQRERPVMVRDVELDQGTSGAWVRTEGADWILVNTAHQERRLQVIAHEVGHMVLGHHDGLARSHYDDPDERAAELFGTLLVQHMRKARLGSASSALR